MAENRNSTLKEVVGIAGGLLPIAGMIFAGVVGYANLQGSAADNAKNIARVEISVAETNNRVTRIEEARSIGLQRLAAVEEAVKGQKDILADIRAKLDRVLMGRR